MLLRGKSLLIAVSSQDNRVYLDKQTKDYDLTVFRNCAVSYNLGIKTEVQVFMEKYGGLAAWTKKYKSHS